MFWCVVLGQLLERVAALVVVAAHQAQAVARLVALVVQAQVGHHRIQPGAELGRGLVLGRGAVDAQEGLLHQVFGLAGDAELPVDHRVGQPVVALEQRAESVVVALRDTLHQLVVGLDDFAGVFPHGVGTRSRVSSESGSRHRDTQQRVPTFLPPGTRSSQTLPPVPLQQAFHELVFLAARSPLGRQLACALGQAVQR